MMHNRKNSGFTLIELMIVVAIIAIIASVAIPRLMSARLSANESAAISTLRSLSSSQAQVQSSGAIDTDADGSGEYGYFAELAGSVPVRISVAGVPAAGVAGVDNLTPAVLSAAFGAVNVSVVTRSGYVYQVWLPNVTVAGAVAGIAEDPGGGKAGAPYPDPDNGEVFWCAYAWPMQAAQSGNRTFFINEQGDLLQTLNRGGGAYTGTAGGPPVGAAYSVANDMSSPVGINGIPASDGNTWTTVQ